jgi:hypothetical protein
MLFCVAFLWIATATQTTSYGMIVAQMVVGL